MTAKEEFDLRKALFYDLADELSLKSRYSISDDDLEEAFFAFLFKRSGELNLKTQDKRKLGLSISLSAYDIEVRRCKYI